MIVSVIPLTFRRGKIKELLKEYRSAVDEHHPDLSAALRPGLPREEITEKLELALHFPICEDAIELYCWAEGIDLKVCEAHIIPISFFLPLESAINSFHSLQDALSLGDPEKFEDSFQFLSDGSCGGYAFGSMGEPCEGRIVRYDIHDDWTIGFNSLRDLLETAIEGYRIGLVEDNEWCIVGFSNLVKERYPNLNAG